MIVTHHPTGQTERTYQHAVLVLVMLATALANLEVGLVNVALPTLATMFGVGRATIQWVAIAYQLAIVGTLVPFGRLVDIIGGRILYLAGMATVAVASLLAALSQTALWLILARGMLGLGAAMLLATGQALIALAYPERSRGQALGFMHMAVAAGLLSGPSVGGLLITTIGWRWVFLAPLVLAAGAFIVAWVALPRVRTDKREALDLAGAILICAAAILMVVGLTRLTGDGWSGTTGGLLLLALCAVMLFVGVERRHPAPLFDLRLLRAWPLAAGLLTAWVTFIALAANMFLVPFALQTLMGYSAAVAGLVMMTVPIAILPIAPFAGRLADRFSTRVPTTMGLATITSAIIGMSQFRSTTPLSFAIIVLALYGIGAGLFQAPNNSAVLGAAPAGRVGVVSGMLALSRNLGQVIGIVLASGVWAWRQAQYEHHAMPPDRALAAGLRDAFFVLAGCGLLALIISAGRGRAGRNE